MSLQEALEKYKFVISKKLYSKDGNSMEVFSIEEEKPGKIRAKVKFGKDGKEQTMSLHNLDGALEKYTLENPPERKTQTTPIEDISKAIPEKFLQIQKDVPPPIPNPGPGKKPESGKEDVIIKKYFEKEFPDVVNGKYRYDDQGNSIKILHFAWKEQKARCEIRSWKNKIERKDRSLEPLLAELRFNYKHENDPNELQTKNNSGKKPESGKEDVIAEEDFEKEFPGVANGKYRYDDEKTSLRVINIDWEKQEASVIYSPHEKGETRREAIKLDDLVKSLRDVYKREEIEFLKNPDPDALPKPESKPKPEPDGPKTPPPLTPELLAIDKAESDLVQARENYAKVHYEMGKRTNILKRILPFTKTDANSIPEVQEAYGKFKEQSNKLLNLQLENIKQRKEKGEIDEVAMKQEMGYLVKRYNFGEKIALFEARTNARAKAQEGKTMKSAYKMYEKYANWNRKFKWWQQILIGVGAGAVGLGLIKRGLGGVGIGIGVAKVAEGRYRRKEEKVAEKSEAEIIGILGKEGDDDKMEALRARLAAEIAKSDNALAKELKEAKDRFWLGLAAAGVSFVVLPALFKGSAEFLGEHAGHAWGHIKNLFGGDHHIPGTTGGGGHAPNLGNASPIKPNIPGGAVPEQALGAPSDAPGYSPVESVSPGTPAGVDAPDYTPTDALKDTGNSVQPAVETAPDAIVHRGTELTIEGKGSSVISTVQDHLKSHPDLVEKYNQLHPNKIDPGHKFTLEQVASRMADEYGKARGLEKGMYSLVHEGTKIDFDPDSLKISDVHGKGMGWLEHHQPSGASHNVDINHPSAVEPKFGQPLGAEDLAVESDADLVGDNLAPAEAPSSAMPEAPSGESLLQNWESGHQTDIKEAGRLLQKLDGLKMEDTNLHQGLDPTNQDAMKRLGEIGKDISSTRSFSEKALGKILPSLFEGNNFGISNLATANNLNASVFLGSSSPDQAVLRIGALVKEAKIKPEYGEKLGNFVTRLVMEIAKKK